LKNNYQKEILLPDIKSKISKNINEIDIHYLEAGSKTKNSKLIVLLHGFPELAFSWRKILIELSLHGYHVIAPDQRGFGKTYGANLSYTNDLSTYSHLNLVKDIYLLSKSLGYENVKCIVGHDSGAAVASWASLLFPNYFKNLVIMSAPFTGPPNIPDLNILNFKSDTDLIDLKLEKLKIPRKHYQTYFRSKHANDDIMNCKQGLKSFIRAYYHYKSADWAGNAPYDLSSWSAKNLSKMPTYYIMNKNQNMPETVNEFMPNQNQISNCIWLTEDEIQVYVNNYSKTTFQGGLNWYRSHIDISNMIKMSKYNFYKIIIPSIFIAGSKDWGTYQKPGSLEKMKTIMNKFEGINLIDNAGHWVQQEQPKEVVNLILKFLYNK
jgi:pimeloyl-ACP methyl ester carboxylesterase